jgi:catechol 2,3-dioxygenase-like lactoylglutathione lyase family enzyme
MADEGGRARLVGINHIALEVGEIDAALDFYARVLAFELRGRVGSRLAFIDAGDQFIALSAGRRQPADEARHFGLVVDDAAAVRRALVAAGVEILPGSGLDFRDPWGNRIQIVQYDEIQFLKSPAVLRSMGLEQLGKTPDALAQLQAKGVVDDPA